MKPAKRWLWRPYKAPFLGIGGRLQLHGGMWDMKPAKRWLWRPHKAPFLGLGGRAMPHTYTMIPGAAPPRPRLDRGRRIRIEDNIEERQLSGCICNLMQFDTVQGRGAPSWTWGNASLQGATNTTSSWSRPKSSKELKRSLHGLVIYILLHPVALCHLLPYCDSDSDSLSLSLWTKWAPFQLRSLLQSSKSKWNRT